MGVPGRQSCKSSLGEQRKGRTGLVCREMRLLWLGVGEQGWRWAEGVASWGGVSVVGKLAARWAGGEEAKAPVGQLVGASSDSGLCLARRSSGLTP